MKYASFIFVQMFFLFPARGVWELYRYDPASKQCVAMEEKRPRRLPHLLKDLKHVDPEFLKRNPICREAPTCLDDSRLQRLIQKNRLPSPFDMRDLENSRFKERARRGCIQKAPEPVSDLKSLLEYFKIGQELPIESKMAVEIIEKTKSNALTFLEDSKIALEALSNCLRFDANFPDYIPAQERVRFYQAELALNDELQKGCERIWQPDNEIERMKATLAKVRQSLFSQRVVAAAGLEKDDELEYFVNKLRSGKINNHRFRNIRAQKLIHRKDGIAVFQGAAIWKGGPDALESLTDKELAGIPSYLKLLRENYPNGDLEDVLALDYQTLIEENPVLVYFSDAEPGSLAIAKGFEEHKKKWQELEQTRIDDVAFLDLPMIFELTLHDQPPELVGDYCVLAEKLLRNWKRDGGSVSRLISAFAMAEAGWAMFLAKGIGKKTTSFLFGARYMGSLLAANEMQRALADYNRQISLCVKSTMESLGTCRMKVITNADSQALVSLAMMMAFGPKPVKAVVPLYLFQRDSADPSR